LERLIIAICYSNFWVAFQIALLSYLYSATYLPSSIAWKYSLLVFLGSFIVYLGLRRESFLQEPASGQQPQLFFIYRHRLGLTVLGFAATLTLVIFLFWLISPKLMLCFIPLVPIVFFYNIKTSKNKFSKLKLRNGAFKPLTITLCVVWVVYFAPFFTGYFFYLQSFSLLRFFLEALAISMFVFSVAIAFDIRDISFDKLAGMKTIPMLLGERKTRLFAMVLLFSYALVFALVALLELNTISNIWPHFLTAIAAIVLFYDKQLTTKSWEYLFWYDGLLGFPTILWLIF
jgi:4-hydroxybenzoate polyprenyltransferase